MSDIIDNNGSLLGYIDGRYQPNIERKLEFVDVNYLLGYVMGFCESDRDKSELYSKMSEIKEKLQEKELEKMEENYSTYLDIAEL